MLDTAVIPGSSYFKQKYFLKSAASVLVVFFLLRYRYNNRKQILPVIKEAATVKLRKRR